MSAKPATASDLHDQAEAIADAVDPPAGNVVEALRRVMRDLPAIGKDGRADPKQGGYAYRGIEQITAHTQRLFARHGVVMAPRVVSWEVRDIVVNQKPWTDTYTMVEYDFFGPAGVEDRITVGPLLAIGRDNSDKGANKCATQAMKYALLQVLCISDGKDDADAFTHEAEHPAPRWERGHAKQMVLAAVGGESALAAEAWAHLDGDNHWQEWEHDFPQAALDAWLNEPDETSSGSSEAGATAGAGAEPTDGVGSAPALGRGMW